MAQVIRFTRFTLSGALVGVAVVGAVSALFGFGINASADIFGAVAGGGATALLVKFAHIV